MFASTHPKRKNLHSRSSEKERKGFVTRQRSTADERNLIVSITEAGELLKEKAVTVPAEIAYELALQGKKPFIVEMVDDIIKVKGVSAANSNCLRDLIKYHEIPISLETKTPEVKEASIVVEKNGQAEEIPADSVIVSIGYMAGNPFVQKKQKHVHILGDADHVANLKAAIWAAFSCFLRFFHTIFSVRIGFTKKLCYTGCVTTKINARRRYHG